MYIAITWKHLRCSSKLFNEDGGWGAETGQDSLIQSSDAIHGHEGINVSKMLVLLLCILHLSSLSFSCIHDIYGMLIHNAMSMCP